MAALSLGAPASTASELELDPTESKATCSCAARHEAMMGIRDYLKELKEQEAATADTGKSETDLPEEAAQAGS